MNKSFRINILVFSLILLLVIVNFNSSEQIEKVQAENQNLKTEMAYKEQVAPVLEEPYTQITDLSSVMYVNRVTIDTSNAVYWTDVNGISGFDVTMGDTLYRYVEGHIQGRQLALYAPYISYMDEWSDLDD